MKHTQSSHRLTVRRVNREAVTDAETNHQAQSFLMISIPVSRGRCGHIQERHLVRAIRLGGSEGFLGR